MRHEIRFTAKRTEKYLEFLEPLIFRKKSPIEPFEYKPLPDGGGNFPDVDFFVNGGWEKIEPFTYWGQWQKDFILKTSFIVSDDMKKEESVFLYLPLGDAGDFSHPEALLHIDGKPYAACDRHHQEVLLPKNCLDGKPHELVLTCWTGLGGFNNREDGSRLLMKPCFIVSVDKHVRELFALGRVAVGVAINLGGESPVAAALFNALESSFNLLDTRQPTDKYLYESVPAVLKNLKAGIKKAGYPLDFSIVATGHSHIDVAWLWTLAQTRKKTARTFHNVLRLMERYPEYHFTQSQPQLYDYMKNEYPELFESIKKRVAEGRWEIIGGMWVEADCNITGSESLARQFLLGRSFFRENFGADAESPVLWLPDVFGYSWNLPQLIKLSGLEYFFTTKIGWNQYNRLPYDTFWWQGLDGTKVLTHFSPTPSPSDNLPSTYNGKANPEQILATWTNFRQKELLQDLLMCYGYGDGGGGPTSEMLENLDIMKEFPGSPKIVQKHAGDFYRELEKEKGDSLPTWNGELYLELHRGTYTTQSRNKRANRKSEFALHDAEFLASYAGTISGSYRYPGKEFRKAWELVCLNQFHDIIPGSSIGEVYKDSLAQYEQVFESARTETERAIGEILNPLDGDIALINPSSFERDDIAVYPGIIDNGKIPAGRGGVPSEFQISGENTLINAGILKPFSVTPLKLLTGIKSPETKNPACAGERLLENAFIRVEFDKNGDITRIFDKRQEKEVLPAGAKANVFQAFEDRPINWDAWDIDIFFENKVWYAEPADSIEIFENGPLRAALKIKRRILGSVYTQKVSITSKNAAIDIETNIDWHEKNTLLKAAFPVDVLSPAATYEIQWGNVQRPTHRNTSWDWARFETCAQKWVDLSEGGYGASLINDCKYGHDIKDNLIRISLLRGTTNPDENADQGSHTFAYRFLPHSGPVGEETVASAYSFNDSIIVRDIPANSRKKGGNVLHGESFIATDTPNVVIETVKQAEDGNGIIVRVYESMRKRVKVTIETGFEIDKVFRTSIIEDDIEKMPAGGRTITFEIKPFEITNLRIVPKK